MKMVQVPLPLEVSALLRRIADHMWAMQKSRERDVATLTREEIAQLKEDSASLRAIAAGRINRPELR